MSRDCRFHVTLAVGTVAAGMALVSCGGHAVTKQDVIARGNQICESAVRAVRSVTPPAGPSLADLAVYYKRVTPIVSVEVQQLESLPRPPQDRSLLARYLNAIATSAGEYRSLTAAAAAGDGGALAGASAALRSSPASALATRYGLDQCAAPPATSAS